MRKFEMKKQFFVVRMESDEIKSCTGPLNLTEANDLQAEKKKNNPAGYYLVIHESKMK
jgi:hypothetical protein